LDVVIEVPPVASNGYGDFTQETRDNDCESGNDYVNHIACFLGEMNEVAWKEKYATNPHYAIFE